MDEQNSQRKRPRYYEERERQQPQGVKKKTHWGCLIAALVVVLSIPILGILAAVAIPGFMHYAKHSKNAEAKVNIQSLIAGAQAYKEANGHYLELPEGARLGPVVDESTAGFKSNPDNEDFEKTPWKELHFKIFSPHYYTYYYVTKETPSGTVVEITASASLKTECDSVFIATIDDVLGPSLIVEIESDVERAELCNPVK